jgi:[Skp1-protein]-hydroxyproline N-acetylglucosaminyltransferase
LSDDDARQRDALQGKPLLTRNRRITAVYYLNEAWNREDGGALRIYADTWTPDARPFDVLPRLDRLVLFRSTLAHEVLVTRKERLALTQWWYGRIDDDNERVPWRLPAPGRALSGLSTEGRILVSVAAYRDPETERTLQHLFATAKDPKRIRVVVVQQYDCLEGTDDDLVGRLYNHEAEQRITRIRVDFRDANGPCPARACALRRLTDEDDFVLQIDSHTRFRSHWDAYLIDQLAKCDSEEPVLTAYPVDYDKDAAALPSDVRPTLLVPSGFDKDGVLRIKGRRLARVHDKPVPSPLWCAGFSFCRANVWRRVKYEPLPHLFFGEELLHAARLFCSGCDFFAPPEQVLFHRWSRSGRRTLAEDQPRRNVAAARGRAFDLLKELAGPRSLAAFEARAGVDLQRRVLLPGADRGGLSPEAFADGAPSAAGAQVAALLGLKL